MSTLSVSPSESTGPAALPDVHPGTAGGCKVNVPVRIVRYHRDGVIVSRDYSGACDDAMPTAWLPWARITLVDVSCLGHAKCVMPVWLYRKTKDQLAGAAAEKSPVPAGWVEFPCAICQRPTVFRDEAHDVACTSCRRAQAESAANGLRQEIANLRKGEPPFDVLTPRERAQELAQLNGAPDPIERTRIELEDQQLHQELTMAREAAEQELERWDAFA